MNPFVNNRLHAINLVVIEDIKTNDACKMGHDWPISLVVDI